MGNMEDADVKVGAKVCCKYKSYKSYNDVSELHYGKVGTISYVERFEDGRVNTYYVVNTEGVIIGGEWTLLGSWDLLEAAAEEAVSAPPTFTGPPDLSIPIEVKPCPMSYYGTPPCTCGDCRSRPRARIVI